MSGNEFGKIFKRAWGDPDFKLLGPGEQLLYFKLISQPDVSLAGVLTYAPVRWATQTAGYAASDIEDAFKGLITRDYVRVDYGTQEVLIRSYIRNDLGWKSPRTMIGIANAVGRVLSPVLRGVISHELTRLDTSDLSGTINDKTGRSTRDVVETTISGVLSEFPPLDTPSDGVSDTPSEGVSKSEFPPLDTPSHTPSHGVSEGVSEGVSQGVSGVRALNSNSNCNSRSRSRSRSNIEGAPADSGDDPPMLVETPATDVALPQKSKRGTRLPDGFQPSRTPGNLEAEAGRDPEWLRDQLQRFRDHWAAESGAKGVKADWDATWRNWIRRSADFAPRRPLPNNPTNQGVDWDAAAARAAERDRQAERDAS